MITGLTTVREMDLKLLSDNGVCCTKGDAKQQPAILSLIFPISLFKQTATKVYLLLSMFPVYQFKQGLPYTSVSSQAPFSKDQKDI